jgi:hypothetical protein
VFVLCWLLVLGLCATRENISEANRFGGLEDYFDALLCSYIPLCFVLSAALAMGEEPSLGTHTRQLTLPVPAWRLWAVKCATAGSLAVLLGWLLPAVMIWLADSVLQTGLQSHWADHDYAAGIQLIALSATFYVVGLWVGPLAGNTVRGALGSVLGTALLLSALGFGASFNPQLVTNVICDLVVWLQVGPDFFDRALSWAVIPLGLTAGLLVVLLMLRQSFVFYRRAHWLTRQLALRGVLVLGVTFLVAAGVRGLAVNPTVSAYRMLEEVWSAVSTVEMGWSGEERSAKAQRMVTFTSEELAGTGMLGPDAERWLRGSTVACVFNWREGFRFRQWADKPDVDLKRYLRLSPASLTIRFPSGNEYSATPP